MLARASVRRLASEGGQASDRPDSRPLRTSSTVVIPSEHRVHIALWAKDIVPSIHHDDRRLRQTHNVPTVVLLGYSCAGKSTIADDVCERWPEVDSQDSDRWVSKPYGDHIYNMFIQLGRDNALSKIEQREGEFLDSLLPVDGPRIIAAGPALPSRPQWSSFVRRVQPTFVYLVMSEEEELDALERRRIKHLAIPAIAGSRLFGSWNQDLTTRYDNGRWVLVDRSTALANIRREMAKLVDIYESHAEPEHTYTQDERWGPKLPEVVDEVGHLLQVH